MREMRSGSPEEPTRTTGTIFLEDFPATPGMLSQRAGGQTAEQQDIFSHVQSLLAVRQAHPALQRGKQWHVGWDESYYAFVRELPEEKLFVVYNNSSSTRDLKIPTADT